MNEQVKEILNHLDNLFQDAGTLELSDIFKDYFYGEKFKDTVRDIISKYIENNCKQMLEVKIDETIKTLSSTDIFGWNHSRDDNLARQFINTIVTEKKDALEVIIDKAINTLGKSDIESSLIGLLQEKIKSYSLSIAK